MKSCPVLLTTLLTTSFALGLAGCGALPEAEPETSGSSFDLQAGTGRNTTVRSGLAAGEGHPFHAPLRCERAPGSYLVGVLYDISAGFDVEVARFSSGGNVGACELALRASRDHRVCLPGTWWGYQVHDLVTGERVGSFSELGDCTAVTSGDPALATEDGYLDWLPPEERDAMTALLPALSDPLLDEAMHAARAIWYDEASKVFVYQDSFGSPKGLRANRVGYDVGSTSSVPDIRALTEYFQPQKFKFPFAITAGATFAENTYARYFWLPPEDEAGDVLPVRVWRNNTHWQWVFPVGTVLGEVLHIQAPDDGSWHVFEVRTRVRRLDGWDTGVFRPFASPAELSAAIQELRPAWVDSPDIAALIEHLDAEEGTLEAHTLEAPNYELLFPALHGAMDYLPEVSDYDLVRELLARPMFVDTMGGHWRSEGELTTFAASTHAPFHIVPRDYPAGMFELTEAGCKMCHDQTSRPLNNLDPRVVLYGEVWGEDEIFTWHPFAIDAKTFSVADYNRSANPRLMEAGLIEWGAPASTSETWQSLPKAYAPVYE